MLYNANFASDSVDENIPFHCSVNSYDSVTVCGQMWKWKLFCLFVFFSTELASRSSSIDTWKIDAQIKSNAATPEPAMAKNKQSLKALLRAFAEDTSAHGVGKIASAESIFWSLLWTLGVMVGTGMVIYQGITLLETYVSRPVKSDIDVTYIRVSNA